ncbi:MAG: hypothetical protein IBX57_00825 [Gammaproteobacteria bacterium]|nr:hypothetical protein [Gammaproteobacteria bacterium]
MSTTNYRRYVENTLKLAKSITIKNNTSVSKVNEYLKLIGFKISDDPSTWKFNMNMAGMYHQKDQPMSITSLDTLEQIDFTKENLANHIVTKTNYYPGSNFYKDLVTRFPEQELLIRGIINPVPIERVIEAQDYEILHVDDTLVESNEVDLLPLLQEQLYGYRDRWLNPAYNLTDELYLAAHLGVMYTHLPIWIMNIRLSKVKTTQAHSFHIREYLKSHGKLDKYIEYLSKAQMLFLYRNVLYLEKNAGRSETFEWLIDKIMSDRGLGIAKYTLNHKVDELVENLRPDVILMREGINQFHRSSRLEAHTLEETLVKQRPAAKSNMPKEEKMLVEGFRHMQNSKRSKLSTKIIESSVIDWAQSGVVLKPDFLFYHWLYYASTGRYSTIVRTTHPRTNAQIDLNTKDAFIVYMYCFNKSLGVTLTDMPKFVAKGIRRSPTPSFDELRRVVNSKYVSDDIIRHASNQVISEAPIVTPYNFIMTIGELYKQFAEHREVYSLQEHHIGRGQVQALMDHLYMETEVELLDQLMTYQDYFKAKGYDFNDMLNVEYSTLADDILDKVTGSNLSGSFSIGDVQRAMLGILSQMSSYTVQYLSEVNDEPIVFWDWPSIRAGDTYSSSNIYQKTKVLSRNFNSLKAGGVHTVKFDTHKHLSQKFNFKGEISINMELAKPVRVVSKRVDYLRVETSNVRVLNVVDVE